MVDAVSVPGEKLEIIHHAVDVLLRFDGDYILEVGPGLGYSQEVLGDMPMSEDCLHLNIWTGAPHETAKRPVMVWLLPGSFMMGDGLAKELLYWGSHRLLSIEMARCELHPR